MDYFAEPGAGQLKTSEHEADLTIAGKDKNLHGDTRRDRIEKLKGLAELVGKQHAGNVRLTSLLKSHNAAVRDPDNELVQLHREACPHVCPCGDLDGAASRCTEPNLLQWEDPMPSLVQALALQ